MSRDVDSQKILIVLVAQAVVSIFIAYHVGRFVEQGLTLSIGRLLPLDFEDILVRIPSAVVGVSVAWQLWGCRFLMPLLVSATYLHSDYLKTFETVTIDWSPFQSLGRQAGFNLWGLLLILATLVGTLSGQWLAIRLRKQFLRTYMQISERSWIVRWTHGDPLLGEPIVMIDGRSLLLMKGKESLLSNRTAMSGIRIQPVPQLRRIENGR
jgi:hypothetical protein